MRMKAGYGQRQMVLAAPISVHIAQYEGATRLSLRCRWLI
jgi:hypothetical protein